MNRPLPKQPCDLRMFAVTAEPVVLGNGDSSQRKQLRSGRVRGRREIKTASRRRKRRRTTQRQT